MATKYPLSAPFFEDTPDSVEGFRHWVVFRLDETQECVIVLLKYWDGTTEVGRTFVRITRQSICDNGGPEADWDVVCACADNSSDTDDVVQMLATPGTWGMRLLWGKWRTLQGQ